MLRRTHLAFALLIALLFFSKEEGFILFTAVCLFSSVLPDIDTRFSKIGKHKIFRIVNFFTKHRGIFHSLTFLIIASVLLYIFVNQIFLAFAAGYCSHLVLDCLTLSGVRIFYPFKIKIRGILKTNGIIENVLFFALIIADFYLLFRIYI